MDGADLGHRIAAVSKAFSGFSVLAHGGATCQPNIPMAPPAGVVCGGGKSRGCGCGPGKPCWPGWMNESCSTGKRPFSTRPLCWRKRGQRRRKNPSRERYEVHGGGRRPGYTYSERNLRPRRSPSSGSRKGTLARASVSRAGRGRPRQRLRRVIADRGYDSDKLRQRLWDQGTELIAPYLRTRKQRRFEDKRKLRRYRRRWKIERTNAWLQSFRRVQVRYDRILSVYQGFFHCACLIITLRHLCN